MTGSINDVDGVFNAVIVPISGDSSRGYRYASLLFLGHPVHRSRSVVNLAHFVSNTCIIQYTLRSRGFTRVYVSHNADVSRILKHVVHFVLASKMLINVLESEECKRFVSLCHAVSIFFFLESRTFFVVSSHYLSSQLFSHRMTRTQSCITD